MKKSIVVYFSRNGENYLRGNIVDLKVGNTKIVSEFISKELECPTYEIRMKNPYSSNYNTCIKEALNDQKSRKLVDIYEDFPDFGEISDIYLGYPNYWNTCPQCIKTFLSKVSLKGKTIHPFCLNEGSGLGISVSEIKGFAKDAIVTSGLSINGSQINNLERIKDWIKD